MEDAGCPRCKTTKYRNPGLKLLVNVCGHTLCENCVSTLFVQGSGECQECHIPLRRNNFRQQLFEDASVERDVDIRRKILRDFNKKEEDFPSLLDYNNYLELVETLNAALLHTHFRWCFVVLGLSSDFAKAAQAAKRLCQNRSGLCGFGAFEWTRQQIDKYREENLSAIKHNRSKLSREEELLEQLIAEEEQQQELSRQRLQHEVTQTRLRRQRNKEELIDELMLSDLPADHIVDTHHMRDITLPPPPPLTSLSVWKPLPTANASNTRIHAAPKFSVSSQAAYRLNQDSSSTNEVAALYVYRPLELDYQGPVPPSELDIKTLKYLAYIRSATREELGGGFRSTIACQRALQDAFCGLYFSSTGSSS